QRTTAATTQLRDGGVGRHQYGTQVEIDRALELAHVDAFDRRRTGMPDMVPDEVETAERLHSALHDLPREVVVAQIASERDGLAAVLLDLLGDGFGVGGVDVDDRDARALAREPSRAGPSHPRRRRGDDPDLAGQSHRFLLLLRSVHAPSAASGARRPLSN